MKTLFSISYVVMIILKIVLTADPNETDDQKWNSYKIQFNKTFATSEEENEKKKIYFENEKKIAEHNARYEEGQETYEMGMNHFGDLSVEEFAQIYLAKSSSSSTSVSAKPTLTQVSKLQVDDEENSLQHFNITFPPFCGPAPREINWVHRGAMTSVKNQGKCGCCWAFSVAATIEAHIFKSTEKKQSLSPQNLLDCVRDKYGKENSCKVGAVIDAYQYIVDNGGIDTEESYPYQEKQSDTCQYNSDKKGASISDFKRIEHGNVDLMRDVVAHIGPVTCHFHAEVEKFIQFYKSGIYHSDTCQESMESLNHSFVIVGYGTEGRLDYWQVKNSWGTGWGENGYARIARKPNTCGIATDVYFPVV